MHPMGASVLCHTRELLCVRLAPCAPGPCSDFSGQRERSRLSEDYHLIIQPTSPRNYSMPSLELGIRDEMENETQVLPSGADSSMGESGQEMEDDSPAWGGLCWRGAQRAHGGAAPKCSLERRSLQQASWRR